MEQVWRGMRELDSGVRMWRVCCESGEGVVPVTRMMVSLPDKSVMCCKSNQHTKFINATNTHTTKVSLKEA
jgi:hypothetical protein